MTSSLLCVFSHPYLFVEQISAYIKIDGQEVSHIVFDCRLMRLHTVNLPTDINFSASHNLVNKGQFVSRKGKVLRAL